MRRVRLDLREESVKFLDSSGLQAWGAMPGLVGILENALKCCADRHDDPYFSVCMKAGIKGKYCWQALLNLSLDGLGKESGSILRVMLEYMNLIDYVRARPNQAAEFNQGILPRAGLIAREVAPAFKGVRDWLSDNAAHQSFSDFALDHIWSKDGDLLLDRPLSTDSLLFNVQHSYIVLALLARSLLTAIRAVDDDLMSDEGAAWNIHHNLILPIIRQDRELARQNAFV